MEPKKKLVALIVTLIFLSKNSFSNDKKILLAVAGNDLDLLERFIKKDNSISSRMFCERTGRPRTLLERAAANGYSQIVELLLHHGADPNMRLEAHPFSIIAKAIYLKPVYRNVGAVIEADHQKVIELLLQYGANPNITDSRGDKPISLACLYSFSEVIAILMKYGATADKGNYPRDFSQKVFQVIGGDLQGTERLLQEAKRKCECLERLLNTKEVNLPEIKDLIADDDVPVYAKIKALVFLIRLHEWDADFVSIEDIKHYYKQIPFAYSFFSNDTLFGFALENRYLVDFRRQRVEEAMEMCMLPGMISTIFGRCAALYGNKNLINLLKIDGSKRRKKKQSRQRRRKMGVEQEQENDLVAKILVRMVKKARRAGRRDFVKKFYRTYELCRCLSSSNEISRFSSPPEVAGHIISFTE